MGEKQRDADLGQLGDIFDYQGPGRYLGRPVFSYLKIKGQIAPAVM